MKKSYLFICSLIALSSINANSANLAVSVTNNTFTPQTFTAAIGDIITWTFNAGTHNVTSQSVPTGAATLASGNMSSGTYVYTVTHDGNYGYGCSLHLPLMVGGFTVSTTTGILAPATNLLTTAYPNPVKDKLTVKYDGLELIEVLNVIGEKIQTIALDATESKVEIDFSNLPSGMYFYRTYKEGAIVETKRIVKTK
jgi:plastocyanin